MLELSEQQLARMQRHEHAGFVGRVHAEIVREFPELAGDVGLLQRLNAAHDRALALGLESGRARTQFLYQEAFAPGLSQQPAVTAWISRPGASPEQRWNDFMALANARLGVAQPGQV